MDRLDAVWQIRPHMRPHERGKSVFGAVPHPRHHPVLRGPELRIARTVCRLDLEMLFAVDQVTGKLKAHLIVRCLLA